MKIQKLTAAHLKACAKILEAAYSLPPFNEKWQGTNAYKYLVSKLKCCDKYSYVLVDGGAVRGFILVNLSFWASGPQAIIEEVVVDPKYQHQGFGSQLMKYADAKLKTLKVKSTLLWTNKKSSGHKFHKKHGFTQVSDLVIMSK